MRSLSAHARRCGVLPERTHVQPEHTNKLLGFAA